MSKEARASKARARESARDAMRHRIVLAFAASSISQAEIAKLLGVDKSRVSRWFNADVKQGEVPGPDYLPLLPDLLEVDGHWLLTGEGPMRRAEPRATRVALDRIERALREMRNGDD